MKNQNHIVLLLLTCLMVLASCAPKVQQLNEQKLKKAIMDNQFTLVYFYSATCTFCKEFTPKFEQLAKIYPKNNTVFGKIDAVAYPKVSEKYDVYSYPTIAFFWRNVDLPIFYRKQRQIQNLLAFIKTAIEPINSEISKERLDKLTTEERHSGILFVGNKDSFENNVVSVLSFVESYRGFVRHEANVTQPYIEVKGEKYFDFENASYLRSVIRQAFARTYIIEEESWLRIFERKQTGIVFIDTKNNKNLMKILQKLAIQMPDLVFMRIDPSQEEFKSALDALEVENQENIFGVDEKAKAKFVAEKPYTEESIRKFIQGVLDRSLPVYLRSEKSNHKQKLTRQNFEQKINEPKDVVVFLYREEDRIAKKFMDLFRFLTEKLKENSNISLLRCNISKNQITDKLGFQVKVTPWVVFYGHRMKNAAPVNFQKKIISAENMIEFIMENTTFDWQDEWGEL